MAALLELRGVAKHFGAIEALKGVDTKYLDIYKEYKKELLQLEVKVSTVLQTSIKF